MNLGPIERGLADILDTEAGKDLILVGGAAILVRLETLSVSRPQTVIQAIPVARATEDLDFLLSLDLFIHRERGEEVRRMLDALHYEVVQEHWQFAKGEQVVDLLARSPKDLSPQDTTSVKAYGWRVKSHPSIKLHGRETAEAFAAEINPARLTIPFSDKERQVSVGHPYGLINMKIRAAYDRLVRQQNNQSPKPYSEKHGLDVYRLVASLTQSELAECTQMAKDHALHPVAQQIKQEAEALFASPNLPSFQEAQVQSPIQLDHATFHDALSEALQQ